MQTLHWLFFDISHNYIDFGGAKILIEVLCKNIALTVLDISNNEIGYEGGKTIVKTLCINTTLIL